MRISRAPRTALALVSAAALTLAAGGCAAEDEGSKWAASHRPTVDLPRLNGQKLQVAAVWTGDEQKNFRKVLAEFEKRTGAKVEFVPTGDNVATYIGSKIEGGAPPDVAMLPQVGVLRAVRQEGLAQAAGHTRPRPSPAKNFAKGWQDLGA